jgi:hypothetical protein
MNRSCELPNTDWIAQNHWCVPLYYKGDEELDKVVQNKQDIGSK